MQVKVEDLSSVKKILHIEIPEDKVHRELDDAYKKLKKTAKIKGFRPGKAPRSVLERMFEKDVHQNVSSKLVQDSFVEAIKETELNIVGNPQLDPPDLDKKGPYKYDVTLEVKPEVDDIDFKGLTLKKTRYKVSDEEIDVQLKLLQKNLTNQQPIQEDRPVKEGDFVLIDYEGFKDDKPFSETQKTENFTMKIADGHIAKDFDEQLIGLKKGDTKTFTIHFPEDYFNEKLANLDITFNVKLHEIREEVRPEIDDDFAAQFGKYQNLEDLKKDIEANLEQGYVKKVEQELNEQVFEALIAKSTFELPESMVEYELEGIIQETQQSLAYHNKSMEDLGLTIESLTEKYRDTAEKKVRRHIVLGKIIEQENLTLTDEELTDGFEDMAKAVNQPVDQIKMYYEQNNDKLDFFKHALLEKKAIKLIIDCSTLEESEPEAKQGSEDKNK
jgi:trigger factor